MKKILALVVSVSMVICCLVGCGCSVSFDTDKATTMPQTQAVAVPTQTTPAPDITEAPVKKETPKKKTDSLDKKLAKLDYYAKDAKVTKKNGQMALTCSLKNNSKNTVTGVDISFAAFDKNGKIVKICEVGEEAEFVADKDVDGGLNIKPGQTKKDVVVLTLDSSRQKKISSVKAIVTEVKINNGTEWENPYDNTFDNKYDLDD